MHIGVNALLLKSGDYSGVHVAVRGLIRSLASYAPEDFRLSAYCSDLTIPGLAGDGSRVNLTKPFWPLGSRTGRIAYEQFLLAGRTHKDRVDILHCPAYVMPINCGCPVVLSVHDILALRQPELCTAVNRSHFGRMLPRSLERATRIIVPSEWVRSEVLEWNSFRKDVIDGLGEKIRVIPWGVDERFRPENDPQKFEYLQLKYGLPPRFCLFVGRIEPKKNIVRMIEAFFAATVSRQLPHRLVMVGPRGWGMERELEKTIKELGLSEKIIRPGFVDEQDLPAVYGMAETVLFPSRAEGFGFPLLEAMACGTPVVASDIPPLRELSGGAAVLADPDDLPSLRLALESVLTDEKRMAEMSAAGLKRAAEFTWKSHAEKTLDIYREVMADTK